MGATRSPLDSLLRAFLRFVEEEEPGYSPTSRSRTEAAARLLDVPPELVDALFVSARCRGFLKPIPFGKARMRWQVSQAGEAFLIEDFPAAHEVASPIHAEVAGQ